jgi:hypothetical protein
VERIIFIFLSLIPLVANSGEMVLAKPVFNSQAEVRIWPELLAGSIYSFRFRDMEYIDYRDHGRELQSASSFNWLIECYNPTEAGGEYNGEWSNPTTSILESVNISGSTLHTLTNMAFWSRPNSDYKRPCSPFTNLTTTQNQTYVSGHKLEKNVTIGHGKIENVLDFRIRFHVPSVPEGNAQSQYEVLTGYMPPYFNLFATFDPIHNQVTPINAVSTEQPYPLIFMTADQQHAMGVYSPDYFDHGPTYGKFLFQKTQNQCKWYEIFCHEPEYPQTEVVKWNVVVRHFGRQAVPGIYDFRVFVTFGTLQEVTTSLRQLHHKFPHPRLQNIIGQKTLGVYRCEKNNSSAFYTVWPSEGTNAGLNCAESPDFFLYRSQIHADQSPLFRCRVGDFDHFASSQENCEGQYYEGRHGFLSTTAKNYYTPLRRYFLPNSGHRLALAGQAPAGYIEEGILGWVLSPEVRYLGNVDGLRGDVLHGWACLRTANQSLKMRIFVGKGKDRKQIGAVTANLPHKGEKISDLCQTSGIGHRFSYQIPSEILQVYRGQELSVFAMWPDKSGGGYNSEIAWSGSRLLPD